MVKCFSKCKKKPRGECFPPECNYINGKKRSYCRLGYKYKMNANCETEVRILKGKQSRRKRIKTFEDRMKTTNATRKIQKFMKNIKNKKQILSINTNANANETGSPSLEYSESKLKKINEFNERIKKTTATRKIKKFMKKYEGKRKALFLKSICSDSGVCIAFGREENVIKKFFDNFNNFGLLSKPATTIGKRSANGFVKELTYEKEGYVSNSILKSTSSEKTDNPLYEGLVGLFINKKAKIFPCFLETYGIYNYNTKDAYLEMKDNALTNPSVLETGLTKITKVNEMHINNSCKYPELTAVLIQHLKDAISLNDVMEPDDDDDSFELFFLNDFLYVLFQIYVPLSIISDEFTHNDLHTDNVLLYEPVKGSYIEYHYHFKNDNKILSFKCKYITKLIDYGRCYFNDKTETGIYAGSENIYNAVCAKKECVSCGAMQGYKWLNQMPNPDNSYTSSRYRNKSHDLRLLDIIYDTYEDEINNYAPELKTLFKNLVFYREIDGAPEKLTPGFPDKINFVGDVMTFLNTKVQNPQIINKNNQAYSGLSKLGDLHIYAQEDKPMSFIPVQ
jgi:hypothetical protein